MLESPARAPQARNHLGRTLPAAPALSMLALLALPVAGAGHDVAGSAGFRARPPEDEVVYFLLP
ncbi:MAG: hypothetical protein E6K20_05095, partial [Gammaproteobacteria bacterium]